MKSFKIVGKYKPKEEQRSWARGKEGLQHKKRVYTSEEDFNKYGPKIVERWSKHLNLNLYAYCLEEDGWKLCDLPKKEDKLETQWVWKHDNTPVDVVEEESDRIYYRVEEIKFYSKDMDMFKKITK